MSKKKDLTIIIIFIVIGVLIFGFLGYKIKTDFKTEKKEEVVKEKTLRNLELYGYTLSENDTELYKSVFKDLEAALNEEPINYQDYAKLASELFIIDVYTLNNKISSTDIGGNEFLHKDLKSNFNENMGLSLYRNIQSNIDGKREQQLPEVSKIEATDVTEGKYNYDGVDYDAYTVTLNWEYVVDMGYQNSMKVTLIKENDLLYVVKGE